MHRRTWSHFKISLAAILVVAGFAYYSFSQVGTSPVSAAGEPVPGLPLPGEPIGEVSVIDSELLAVVDKIESLKIDVRLFTDPAFQSLQDYSVIIVPQIPGRQNPFAPIPGISKSANTSQSSVKAPVKR